MGGSRDPVGRQAEPSHSRGDLERGAPRDLLDRGTWHVGTGATLVGVEGSRHQPALVDLVRHLTDARGTGVLVTSNRPSTTLRDWMARGGVRGEQVRYLDCISGASGAPVAPDGRTMFIDSPTMLELVTLRSAQWLQRLGGQRWLLVDSITTLAMHNGVPPVVEFVSDLAARARELGVPVLFVHVDRQSPIGLGDAVRPLCNDVLRL